MKNKKKRLLIIPAKGLSKRIKNKNLKLFYGRPIISYSIDLAIKSKLFNKIHISTDSNKIKKISEKKGIVVDFMRPKKLTSDKAGIVEVVKFVYEKFKKMGLDYDEVWSLASCAPLLDVSDLKSVSKLINKRIMLFVSKFPAPIEWAFKKKDNSILPLNYNLIKKNSQSFKENYYDSGSLIIFPNKFLKKKKLEIKNNLSGYFLPRHKSVDIDNYDDWEFAKKLFRLKKMKY